MAKAPVFYTFGDNPKLAERDVKNISTIIKTSKSADLLKRKLKVETSSFSGLLIGQIIWKKAIGKPVTPLRSDGFSIEIWRNVKVKNFQPGGVTYITIREPRFPSTWNSEDATSYRVHFTAAGITSGSTFHVKVTFASSWTAAGDGKIRYIVPPQQSFVSSGIFNLLQPFEVIARRPGLEVRPR